MNMNFWLGSLYWFLITSIPAWGLVGLGAHPMEAMALVSGATLMISIDWRMDWRMLVDILFNPEPHYAQ